MRPRLVLARTWAIPVLLACLAASCVDAPTRGGTAAREPDEGSGEVPLLAHADIPHAEVAEAFITASTPREDLDSPATWRAPDGTRWVITTAKKRGYLVVFDGATGRRMRTVGTPGAALGQLDRPNGVSVVGDALLVVERDNHRVQLFSLPDFQPRLAFGRDELTKPYGLWAHARDGGIEVIVSDNYMQGADDETVPPLAALDHRYRRYQLRREADGWQASRGQAIGDTTAAGAIRIAESLWADPANDRLLLAEEDVAVGTRLRDYRLSDGRYAGRDVGAGRYRAQAEGIALLACADGSGYWIGTDQFKDRTLFHVFDRRTLAPVGAFAGKRTANTDGIWLDMHGDARFPQGVLYAVHDDQAVAAFDWRDVASSLHLQECAQ